MSNYTTSTPVTQTDDDLFTLIDDTEMTPTCTGDASCTCAWCLREQGITPDSNDSHGICSAHATAIYQAWKAGRA